MPMQEMMEVMIPRRPGNKDIGLRIVKQVHPNGQDASIVPVRLADLEFASWLLHDEPDGCFIVLSLSGYRKVELRGEIALAHIRWIKAGCPVGFTGVSFGYGRQTITPLDWWKAVKAGAPERPRLMYVNCTFTGVPMPEIPVEFTHDPKAFGTGDIREFGEQHARECEARRARAASPYAAEIEKLKAAIKAKDAELAKARETIDRLKREVDRNLGYRDSTREAQALAKVRDELTASVVSLTAERDDLKSRVDRQASTIDGLLAEQDRLTGIVDKQASAVLDMTGKHELAKAQVETLTKERDAMKSRHKRLEDWVLQFPVR